VFSKSSFQLHLIAPGRPRAVYFNDDNYVGWVQGAPLIEVATIDSQLGPVFYTLGQEKVLRPKFRRQTEDCLVCHDSSTTKDPVPRLLMLSVLPDPEGNALGAAAVITNDRSPFAERFGGWYVSGTHGQQQHLGNLIVHERSATVGSLKDYVARANATGNGNITDLKQLFDTRPYLTPNSDIVALMILGHQTHVHNLITRAAYEVKAALQEDKNRSTAPAGANAPPSEDTMKVLKEEGEPIVQAMLFANAAPFTDPVVGTSGFAEEFATRGPRDSHGRSLRDLDLKTRLMKYPLSYLIYSDSFNQMPDVLKQYVYRRIREVLTGVDKSEDFANLSAADRDAILGILQETKPDFAAFLSR
jgi:hypothetical protein